MEDYTVVEWICLENSYEGGGEAHQGPSVVWRIGKDLRRDQCEGNIISSTLVDLQVQSYCIVA